MQKIISTIENVLINKKNFSLEKPTSIVEFFAEKENIKFIILKKPRWEDDSYLLKFDSNIVNLTIKIHKENYPIASNIYQSEASLEKLSKSNKCRVVFKTFVVKQNKDLYRIIFSKFYDGTTLDKVISISNKSEIEFYRILFLREIRSILSMGFHPFLKDLSDFIVIQQGKKKKILLLDHNILIDCSNATEYSKKHVLKLIGQAVDQLFDKNNKKQSHMSKGYLVRK